MRKADCTPEQWSAYLARMRKYRLDHIEKERERLRGYNARPDVIEKRRLREADPEWKKKRRVRDNSPEAKETRAALALAKRQANPEWAKKRNEDSRRHRTGFTAVDYAEAMRIQGGRCAICGDNRDLRADHNHATKKPRGILCHRCNIAEGMIYRTGISPDDFGRRLHDYINNPPLKSD